MGAVCAIRYFEYANLERKKALTIRDNTKTKFFIFKLKKAMT